MRNLTGEPPQEPEYGPGLWTAMPQRSWETMGMARPIDWTGAPSRTEIDLMTMHAIRYGEWLCPHVPHMGADAAPPAGSSTTTWWPRCSP